MDIIFVTYGSYGNYVDAGSRLVRQANSLKVFTQSYLLTDTDLCSKSQTWREWSSNLEKQDYPNRYHQAGKAFLVQYIMKNICKENDVIMYADAGCEIVNNLWSRITMKRLIKKAVSYGGLAEQLDYPEENYTKSELLKHFGNKTEFSKSGQIQNTFFILRCDSQSEDIIDKWIEIINPSTGLWRDPVTRKNEKPCFVDHRRDQSIFSLLWKQSGLPVKKPYWRFGVNFGSWRGLTEPIHTSRNRSGISKLPNFQNLILAVFIGYLLNTFALLRRSITNLFATDQS